MLSRVANSLYWLSRYLERAENLARLADVNSYDALDAVSESKDGSETLWRPLLYATCSMEVYESAKANASEVPDVGWFIAFSKDNPDSIRECIAQARENARMVRDQISEEMWLELNRLHLFMQSKDAEILWERQADEFYKDVINFCLLFEGLIGATILQDQGWHFIQAGKFLERADKTTRVLDMLAFFGDSDRGRLASALRSCSGFSAFRYEYRSDFTLSNVMSFLLFSQSFPRSARFCLRQLDRQLHAISGTPEDAFSNEAERLTGSVLARMNFSSVDSVWAVGLHEYIDELQQQFNDIGQRIFETYVLLPLEIRSVARQDAWQLQWQQQQQQ